MVRQEARRPSRCAAPKRTVASRSESSPRPVNILQLSVHFVHGGKAIPRLFLPGRLAQGVKSLKRRGFFPSGRNRPPPAGSSLRCQGRVSPNGPRQQTRQSCISNAIQHNQPSQMDRPCSQTGDRQRGQGKSRLPYPNLAARRGKAWRRPVLMQIIPTTYAVLHKTSLQKK